MFLQPIHPKIVNELRKREAIISRQYFYYEVNGTKRELTQNDHLSYLVGKLPWVRLVSYAEITDPEKFGYKQEDSKFIRLNHILMGGEINVIDEIRKKLNVNWRKNKIRGGFEAFQPYSWKPIGYELDTQKNRLYANAKKTVYEYSEEKKFTLMPGIVSVDIDNLGRFGSLKQVTVKFQVFSEYDLELYELLYMTPGVTLSLEFGYSIYELNNVLPIEDPEAIYKILATGQIANYAIESGGYYDVAIGMVKNFEFTRTENGWDCTTTFISPGAIPLQLSNMDQVGKNTILEHFENKSKNIQTIIELINKNKDKIKESENKKFKYLTFSMKEFYSILSENDSEVNTFLNYEENDEETFGKNPVVIAFFGNPKINQEEKTQVKKRSAKGIAKIVPAKGKEKSKAADKTVTLSRNLDGEIYVSLGYLEELINLVLFKNGLSVSKIRSVQRYNADTLPTATERMQNVKKENNNKFKQAAFPILIKNHPKLYSLNNSIMILPGVDVGQNEKSQITFTGDDSHLNFKIDEKLSDQGYKFEFRNELIDIRELKNKNNALYNNIIQRYGVFRNILVNIKVIKESFISAISLQNAYKSLLIKISSVIPDGFWNLDVFIDDKDPAVLKIVDHNGSIDLSFEGNAIDKDLPIGVEPKDYIFKLNSSRSILKGYSLNATIPDAFQTAAFVSATSNKPDAILNISRGAIDLIARIRKTNEKTEAETKAEKKIESEKVELEKKMTKEEKELMSTTVSSKFQAELAELNQLQETLGYLIKKSKSDKLTNAEKKQMQDIKKKIKEIKKNSEEKERIRNEIILALNSGKQLKPELIETGKKIMIEDIFEYEVEKEKSPETARLFPITLEMEMDGIAGIYCGSRFYVRNLPSRYDFNTIYQVTNVRHSITQGEWKTSISAMMRPAF